MSHKPIAISSLLAAVAAALFLSACSQEASVEGSLSRAERYASEERYADAEIEYKNVLQKDNRNAQAIAGLGALYFEQGRVRQAAPFLQASKEFLPEHLDNRIRLAQIMLSVGQLENAFQEAAAVLAADPNHVNAPVLLAEAARDPEQLAQAHQLIAPVPDGVSKSTALAGLELKGQNLGAAREHIDQAFQRDPDSYAAYSALSGWHALQGNEAEALEALEQAAANAPFRSFVRIRYARVLAQQGKRDEAAAQLDQIIEKAPDYVPALAQRAELATQARDTAQAKELVDRALRLDPADPTAMRLQGLLKFADNKPGEAITALDRALKQYPNDLQAHYQIALAYIANEQPGPARQHLEKVVNEAPTHLEAAALLSNLLLREGDVSGAIIRLRNLVQNRPESTDAKLLLAEAYSRQNNFAEAHALYQQLEQGIPNSPHFKYMRGRLFIQQNQPAEARAAFEAALQVDPNHLQSVEQLIALDLGAGNREEALARVDAAIEKNPEHSSLRLVRGQALAAMGDSEGAEAAFLEAIELDPASRLPYMLLSQHYMRSGDAEEALANLDKVVAENPRDMGALTLIATIHDQAGNTEASARSYERILEVDSEFVPALNNLAYIYSQDPARLDEAHRLAEQARRLTPNSPYTADTLGWILYKQGRYTWALSLLQEAASQLPDNAEVQYHLGATRYMLGDEANAEMALALAAEAESPFSGIEDARQKLDILRIDPESASGAQRQLLEEALATNEKDPLAYTRLAEIQLQADETADAEANLQKALEISPDNAKAKIGLARVLVRKGQIDRALELTREARRLAPRDPEIAHLQAEIAYDSGDHQWALSLFSDVARQQPDNVEALLGLSKAQLANGRLQDALRTARSAADAREEPELQASIEALAYVTGESESAPDGSAPDTLAVELARAVQAERAGNQDQARPLFQELVKNYPHQAQSKLGLARALADEPTRADEVYQLASDARRLLPNSEEARALQAIARYQQGRHSDAARLFANISSSNWSSPDWHFFYAMAAAETGDIDLAEQQKQLALSAGLAQPKADSLQQKLAAIKAD